LQPQGEQKQQGDPQFGDPPTHPPGDCILTHVEVQ
jgi:hypothetical protein